MVLRPEEGDIFAFARQLCTHHFLPLAEQKGVRLNLRIPEGECRGTLDFDKVDKILYNLLSNAVKYTPSGKNVDFIVEIRQNGTEKKTWYSPCKTRVSAYRPKNNKGYSTASTPEATDAADNRTA